MADLYNSCDLLEETCSAFVADIDIFNERLLYILDKTLQRVKLVSAVVVSREDLNDFWKNLPQEDQYSLGNIVKRYEMMVPQKYDESNEIDAWKATVQSNIIDHDLTKLILNLENNDNFKQYFTISNVEQASEPFKLFMKCLFELRTNVEAHQKENAAQEKQREKNLKKCVFKNDQAKKEISSLEVELAAKKSDLNANIIGKNLLVNRYQGKISRIQKVTQEAIKRRTIESEAAILATKETSTEVQYKLGESLELSKLKYEALLGAHLKVEKQLRLHRLKVENQMVAWMLKFDQDMFERQAEEEQLQSLFESEKKKYDEIQRKLDEQEEEYDELMQEKSAYEQEVLEQKLFIFILNRSARRIQRAFRSYKLEKMAKKKKGKKGKGKKK